MLTLLRYIIFSIFIILSFIPQSEISLLYAQTNNEILKKSIEKLPSQNKIDVILDSARKYFTTDIVKCVTFGDLAISYIDDKITDESKVDIYALVSSYYNNLGNYSKSLEYLLIELKILENSDKYNALKTGKCYVNIGETYRAATDYNYALINLNKSVSIFSSLNNDEGIKGMSYSYERLAAVYFELSYKSDTSNIRKAIEYSNKSIEIADKYNLIARKINNWTILGACQLLLKNYNEALIIFNTALKESYKDSTYSDRCNIMNNIASCYFSMSNYEKSIEYAKQSYDESKKRGVPIYVREACLFLQKSYLALKQYEKALMYQDEYNVISLELFSNEKNRLIDALEQKYQLEKLEEQDKDQRTKYTYIGIGGLIILVLVVIFFLFRQNALNKTNRELEIKNQIISLQKAELEEVNATKNKFFSILAHDLRNPFNGILGFLNILENDFDSLTNDEKRTYIGFVNTSANQVFKLLDRLLQLSRLQDGRYTFKMERINVKEIVGQIFRLQETNAVNKRVNLILEVTNDDYIYADKISIDIVLRNLIDNAIKFTSAGGEVSISTNYIGDNIEICVSDNGVGMDIDDLENIFRLDKKTVSIGTNNEKGTGLGLAVCKEMIDKMNGKISIESVIGKGSKFTITFPRA